MKKVVIILLVFATFVAKTNAQVYITNSAKVQFFSETPLENIVATNTTVSTLINTNTDSVLVRIKNAAFTFKNGLMQDHFNENYMETSKYPYDSFRGHIVPDIDYGKDNVYNVSATGVLNIHGVEKPAVIKGTLTVKDGTIHLDAKFVVRTADFNIEIPKLVFEKIAESIQVSMSADYKLVKK